MDNYGLIPVGDIVIEYAVCGNEKAHPLVLLPCNGCDLHGFDDNVLPALREAYRVVCVSPRGTGRSGRGEGKLTFERMADDLRAVLDALNMEKT